jgi:hypothetical protein
VPRAGTIQYVALQAEVGGEAQVGYRERLAVRAGAFLEGGADPAAEAALPLQRGVRAAWDYEWQATRRDVLATVLEGSFSTFTPVSSGLLPLPRVYNTVASLTETWRHALTLDAQLRIGAGPALTVHRNGEQGETTLLPAAELGLVDRWMGSVLEGEVVLRLAPSVDRVTGLAGERIDAGVTMGWQPSPRWRVVATGNGGMVVQGAQSGDKVAAAEVRAAWSPTSTWSLGVGVRAVKQLPRSALLPEISEGVAFMGLTARERNRW